MKRYNDKWVSVSKRLPKEHEIVQVTYKSCNNDKRYCDESAFLYGNVWYWGFNGEIVQVEIVAWKPLCEPYMGD